MKKLNNLTEEQVLSIIEEVSSRYASRYSFGYYDQDDIKQEAFIIALEALEKYDEIRPLENFLSIHIRNRLITFMRDNYYRRDPTTKRGEYFNEIKKMLIDTIDISVINTDNERRMIQEFDIDEFYISEFMEIIEAGLKPQFREDFLKYMDGLKITQVREQNLINHIKEIVSEKYDENW